MVANGKSLALTIVFMKFLGEILYILNKSLIESS